MSQHKHKQTVATLHLSNEELISIYYALVDIICSMRDFCATPSHDNNQSTWVMHKLEEYVPIQQKFEKYFNDANIKITLPDEDKNSLTLLGIHTDS